MFRQDYRDFVIFVFRNGILINAGAMVALLTLVGSLSGGLPEGAAGFAAHLAPAFQHFIYGIWYSVFGGLLGAFIHFSANEETMRSLFAGSMFSKLFFWMVWALGYSVLWFGYLSLKEFTRGCTVAVDALSRIA